MNPHVYAAVVAALLVVSSGCEGRPADASHRTIAPPSLEPETDGIANDADYLGKKILLVDSYHPELSWSASIIRGVRRTLDGTGADLSVVSMDTKRHTSEEFKRAAASRVREMIESTRPDVVIVADDNASKYLVTEYYVDSEIPFVFCGVNWDASPYGFPYANVTGMVEVALTESIVRQLRKHAKGDRVGFLGPDVLTRHKDVECIQKKFDITFTETAFVKSSATWKEQFLELQESVDMLLLAQIGGIGDWDADEMRQFVIEHTRIPTGADEESMVPFSLLGLTKVGEEQGTWSATTALRILSGTSQADIPLTRNELGNLFINMDVADRLGVVFDLSILDEATLFREESARE